MGGHTVQLSTGEWDYYEVDDYTDPWTEPEIVVYQPGQGRHTDLVFHLVPLFCGRVRFIRRDLRGHGRSSEGKDAEYKFTLDTIVAEEAEFIDKVAGKPVHWMCDSTAGMLGIALAAKYPEKLRSLTLMSTPLVLPYAPPVPAR
jgi:pimeloyl-ACP methyl ester carboxylesterase